MIKVSMDYSSKPACDTNNQILKGGVELIILAEEGPVSALKSWIDKQFKNPSTPSTCSCHGNM